MEVRQKAGAISYEDHENKRMPGSGFRQAGLEWCQAEAEGLSA